MNVKDIQELLDLRDVLSTTTIGDHTDDSELLAALLDWKHSGQFDGVAPAEPPKPRRGKAKTPEPEKFEPSPDPSESDF